MRIINIHLRNDRFRYTVHSKRYDQFHSIPVLDRVSSENQHPMMLAWNRRNDHYVLPALPAGWISLTNELIEECWMYTTIVS
jgi:hypothetical protein